MQIPISRESICLDRGSQFFQCLPPAPQRVNKQKGHSARVERGLGLNVPAEDRGSTG